MMDLHKEVIMNFDQQRFYEVEHTVKDLKDDLCEIKGTVKELCTQIGTVATTMQTVVLKLEERDSRSQENTNRNHETFKRFGDKIDAIEHGLQEMEVTIQRNDLLDHKIETLKQIVYWAGGFLGTSVGAIFVWLVNKTFDKL